MKAKTPHWPLDRVKGLVDADKYWVHTGRAADFFETFQEARATVRRVIGGLTQRSFAHSQQQVDMCDVYALVIFGGGWYLKLCIDEAEDEVAVISFHPLERPIPTNGGMVKPEGWVEPTRRR